MDLIANHYQSIGTTLGISAVILYIVFILLAWRFQESLLFFPGGPSFPECPGIEELSGKPFEEVHKGKQIRGFYFPKEGAQTTIMLFHGNGGNACNRINYVQGFIDQKVNFLLVEYPGYAGSDDELSEVNFFDNATAVWEWWKAGVGADHKLILFGESLGTGVASHLASIAKPELLILHTPFDSVQSVAKHHYPWLPISVLLRHRFDSVEKLKDANYRILMVHGTKDQTIPIVHAETLYKSLPKATPKRFERFPNRDHNDLWVSNAAYWDVMEEEVERVTGGK